MTTLTTSDLLILLTLVALQWALAATLLAPVLDGLARPAARPSSVGLGAGLVTIGLNLFVIYALQRLPSALATPALAAGPAALEPPALRPQLLMMLAALILYAVQLVTFHFWRPLAVAAGGGTPSSVVVGGNGIPAGPQGARRQSLRTGLWLVLGTGAQVFFVLFASELLALDFGQRFVATGGPIPAPIGLSSATLALSAITGGGLWFAAIAGCGLLTMTRVGSPVGFAGPQGLLSGWIERAANLLALAAVARAVAIAAAVLLAAGGHPMGAPHFWGQTLEPAYPLLPVRLGLGVLLPFIYALLIRDAAKRSLPREAALQFMPALVLVAIGEALAVCMTLGMWGVAF